MKTTTLRREGFTLIEIMIVVGILGILAAIAVPNFLQARIRSVTNACINNLREIDSAKQQWALELGQGANASPAAVDLQPYFGRGTPGTLAKVHCPLAKPPGPMAGYTVNTVALPPACNNFNAANHNAVVQ